MLLGPVPDGIDHAASLEVGVGRADRPGVPLSVNGVVDLFGAAVIGTRRARGRRLGSSAGLVGLVVLAACSGGGSRGPTGPSPSPDASRRGHSTSTATREATSPVTLAFGGDVHFEGVSARALNGFGPIAATLRRADLAMVMNIVRRKKA